MARKLWLVQRTDHTGYDEAEGFVVRATDESGARRFAASQAGDEGQSVWLDKSKSIVTRLPEDGEPTVILRAFNVG